MKKKVDERIRTLLENGVKLRHRSMVVVVGDKYRDQVVTLHYLLRNAALKSSPSVLWCYRDQLQISSHKRKRLKQHQRLFERGFIDKDKDSDPFLTFVATNRLTHCKYRDSERVLGNTFGMCVLQDFEALTPNLLARTIETVEGGGLVVMVLRSLSSLTSLFTMVMDVHQRFRTESHSHGAGRFNERFLLSIASCKACVVMDDELNILPISSHIRSLMPVTVSKDIEGLSEAERELQNLKEELQNEFLVGPLVKKCCTMDQGKALVTFFDAILNKTLQSIVALTAARGRGKSAALGLAIAGAVAAGFSNIFVTAPSPENLKTLFEFVCSGLGSLEYKEHLHYDLVRSADPNLKKSIVRINIFKQHRQTIQYLRPNDQKKLSQVELLVIDEAAAIPLPIVKSMLGPYLVFLSSTVNGYEGTGRSLSLKLLAELQKQSEIPVTGSQGMNFKRIELTESIRYASKDPIESWLNDLLCLDVANHVPSLSSHPLPDDCVLYYVNRDTLFSYHKDSEIFLQRMMALYVASHYKNSPNDLQLMADAPAHHLFVLLGPVDESKNELPDIFCVIQVCLEGKISQKSVIKSLSEGHSPSGDQIPWKFSEQFRDDVFPTLSGVRIVRIAVHPSATGRGYGRQALKLLTSYYEGKITSFAEIEDEENEEPEAKITEIAEKVSLLEENITPRANLPPLLVHLSERKPEKLHYIGVSFGLTPQLLRFWIREKFVPFYICQIPNDVTGEHSCMVLKALNNSDIENGKSTYGFIFPYYLDFRERFIQLIGGFFRQMDYNLALGILELKDNEPDKSKESSETIHGEGTGENPAEHSEPVGSFLSPHAMKRLEDYTNNFVDYHTIMDLVPILARRYFLGKLPTKIKLTLVQKSILLCMGLQHKDLSELEIGEGKLKLEKGQLISQFNKIMKKIYKELNDISANKVGANLPPRREILMEPHNISLDDDLREAEKEVIEAKRTEAQTSNGEMEALQDSELLRRYAIVDKDAEFEKARPSKSGLVSIKTTVEKKRKETHKGAEKSNERGKGKNKSHSNKKKRNN